MLPSSTPNSDVLEQHFYVYVYLDPTKPGTFKYGKWSFKYEPFNVGKGSNGRAWEHLNRIAELNYGGTNIFFKRKIRKLLKIGIKPIIQIKRKNLYEVKAFELEEEMIRAIGRRDLKTGSLTNLNFGGMGGSTPGKITRQKMSASAKIKFERMTKDKKENWVTKMKETKNNKSSAELSAISKKLSLANLRVLSRRTEDEKRKIGLKISKAKKRTFAERTERSKNGKYQHPSRKPWNNKATSYTRYAWYCAAHIHRMWMVYPQHKPKQLIALVYETNPNLKLSKFTITELVVKNMVQKFCKGWAPSKDVSWKLFRLKYRGTLDALG